MATRLRLTNSASPYTPATVRGTWNKTSTLASAMSPAGAGTGTTVSNSVGATGTRDVVLRRFVSPAIVTAGPLAGTVSWVMAVSETAAALNAFFHVHIYITAGDTDTVRGTVLSDYIGNTEWATTTTGLGVSGVALSSVNCQVGDRIVAVIGYQALLGSSSTASGVLAFGGTGADLGSGGTATTTPGWMEFSAADALFSTGPPVDPPVTADVVEDFEDTTYITPITGGWVRSTTTPYAGSWCLSSGVTADASTNDVVVTVPAGAVSVRFRYRVSSESGYDFFRVLTDTAQQLEASGTVAWTQSATFDVTGVSTVTFRYIKDVNTLAGEDKAFIDNLTFAVVVPPSPSPGTILNIGPGPTQNHMAIQLAVDGESAIQTHDQSEIAGGFYLSPYYKSNLQTAATAVKCRASVGGPKTAGSSYARCEHRELNADGSPAAWDPFVGTHILHVRVKAIHLMLNKPDAVFAQAFDGDADAVSIRSQFVTSSTRLRGRINGTSATPELANWGAGGLGSEFEMKIEIIAGLLNIYYNDMINPIITSSALIQPATPTWYFKTGIYLQSNTSTDSASDYGEAEIRDLSITHTYPTATVDTRRRLLLVA